MKGILNYFEGLKEALWNFKYILYFWYLSLGLIFSLYFPVHKFFSLKLGHFPDLSYIQQHPAYLSLVFSKSGLLYAGIFTFFLIFYIASLIVESGVWAGILRREPFSYWRRYFWRFLFLEILSPILYLPYLILGGALYLLIKPIPYFKEKTFSWAVIIYILVVFFLLILASVAKDYSKLIVVRENRSVVKAIFFAWKVSFLTWFSSGIMGILALFLWIIPFFLIKTLIGNFPPLLYLIIIQIPILIKIYSKIALYHGEKYMARQY